MTSILVMTQHPTRIHPFVPASLLDVWRDNNSDEFEGNGGTSQIGQRGDGGGDSGAENYGVSEDIGSSSKTFVLQDGGHERNRAFHAVRKDSTLAASKLYATAVRVDGGEKYCNVLRFYHNLPRSLYT